MALLAQQGSQVQLRTWYCHGTCYSSGILGCGGSWWLPWLLETEIQRQK